MINAETITITLAKNANMQVVVPAEATEYEPYILKDGRYYDTVFFRPVEYAPKQKMLCDDHRRQARMLLGEAREKWDAMQEAKAANGGEGNQQPAQQQTISPQPAPQPVAQPTATAPQPMGTLDQIITQLVAQSAQAAVVEGAKPAIDAYVRERYGSLPQIIEVKSEFGTHKVVGKMAKEFDTALKLVAANVPVFLTGPAGCGKNVMCKQIAEALGLDFYFSNAISQEYKITGFVDANGHYIDTQFHQAFTKGGLFFADEMDGSNPEVLIILNAAIANGYFDFPGEGRVEAHKDFRLVAAGNTVGTGADSQYTGRYQLDAATLDRFAILHVGYDRDIELDIAGGDNEIVEFVEDFRNAVAKANILFTASYRCIDRLAKLVKIFGNDIKTAVQLAVVRGLEPDDVRVISNNMTIASKYVNALKSL